MNPQSLSTLTHCPECTYPHTWTGDRTSLFFFVHLFLFIFVLDWSFSCDIHTFGTRPPSSSFHYLPYQGHFLPFSLLPTSVSIPYYKPYSLLDQDQTQLCLLRKEPTCLAFPFYPDLSLSP